MFARNILMFVKIIGRCMEIKMKLAPKKELKKFSVTVRIDSDIREILDRAKEQGISATMLLTEAAKAIEPQLK
jgi:hypothetical protein